MKWFNNLKIGRKLTLTLVVMIAVTLILWSTGFVMLINMRGSLDDLAGIRMKNLELLQTMKMNQVGVITGERGLVIKQMDADLRQAQYTFLDTSISDLRAAWEEYDKQPKTQEEQTRWSEMDGYWQAWMVEHDKVIAASNSKDDLLARGYDVNSDAVLTIDDEIYNASLASRGASMNVRFTLDDMISMNKELTDSSYASAVRNARLSLIILSSIGAAGIVLLLFIILAIIRNLTANVNNAFSMIQTMSTGDLTKRVDILSKDELGVMSETMNSYADALSEILRGIYEAAEQVASGSDQVASGSQELSQGSTEQASSIEQLTSSVSEIAAQTKQNAENANNANTLSGEAMANANTGNEQMQEMLQSMENINLSSANISKIIKVIDDIAFQTNILALNAAVEAARAGQHGKGFAVVAEEVRSLAAKSAQAAKETTTLIEESIKMVGSGTVIAKQTAESLTKIVADISRAAELIGQIAVASNEQAAGIAQIDQGIEQVSQVVQANSATAEQSASASEELSGQAQMLKEMVQKFKFSDDSNHKVEIKQRKQDNKVNPASSVSIDMDSNYGKY